MASTRRKAAAAGLAVIGIAGLSLAAAATLNVTSDSLGAGRIDVSSCDDDGINVAYTVTGAQVTAVVLTGIADACEDQAISIQLEQTDSDDAQVALGSEFGDPTLSFSAEATDDNTATFPVSQPASAVTGVAIVING